MTLREAILDAHENGRADERNYLMAYANQAATLRDLAALLGCSLNTAHRWTQKGGVQSLSRLDVAAPRRTLVVTKDSPGEGGTSPGAATRR